uniref:Structural maintenance of chromosomes protein n=1 Tax=Strigamia maritima TaxID=126957 RepID=T1J4U1_STRMM
MSIDNNEDTPDVENEQPVEARVEVIENNITEENDGAIRIGDIYIPPPPAPACTFDSKGPRLIITHIESENFKSYAGKQPLGPFHKSFTSIVGPNGSGKSNVIDSMLFVFGYKAAKIRSKKIGVLIHNSNKHQSIRACTVTVYFKRIIDTPDDGFEDVPDSKFSISRTADRDNNSFYCINNRKCQFKEVAALLRHHGVDLDHNRFLILQGEVEQIALMKPKSQTEHDTGMLEYLEDIIGSNRFKNPIDILSKKVEELNEQRTEKLNRVKMVEKEKEELEAPKNEAISYLKEENEIFQLKNIVYQCNTLDAVQQQRKKEEEKEEFLASMKVMMDAIAEISAKVQENEKSYKKCAQERDKMLKELDATKARFNKLEAQDVRCREDMKHMKTQLTKLEQNLTKEKHKLEDLEAAPGKLEADIQELTDHRVNLSDNQKKEEAAVTKVMAGLREETKGLQEEKDVHEAELLKLKENVDAKKSKMDLAQAELNIYLSTEENERKKLQEMQNSYQQVCTDMEQYRNHVKEMKKRIPGLRKSLDSNRKELADVSEKEKKISEDLQNKRMKMEEARVAMQASKSKNRVLNALMEEKANGNITGIFGRLGDLGAIEEKYDVAISTACGSLDNIVTDTIDTAQKCVNYLKHNNVGHATFIGLDKMERWIGHANARINTPENVPRLFDLVRVNDKRISPAFYFALRDTLVAEDLNQATRIAFQGSTRYRVVTLKGELIDQSGTMSGGGNRVSKGRMGTNVVVTTEYTPQEVDQMGKRVDELTGQAIQFRRRKEELEEITSKESKEQEILERDHEKLTREIETLIQKEGLLSTNIKNQENRIKDVEPDKKKVERMQKDVAERTKKFDEAAEASYAVEKEVQRLHTIIMEVSGQKMKAAQKKLDAINKKIDDVDSAITKAKVGMKTAERNTTQTIRKITSLETEAKEAKKKSVQLQEELVKLEGDASELVENIDKFKSAAEEKEEVVTKAKQDLRTLQTELGKYNNDKVKVDHKIEHCNKEISERLQRAKYWKKELSNLELHEIDGETNESFKTYSEDELAEKDVKALKYRIVLIEEQLGKKKVNVGVIDEYKKKDKIYKQRVTDLDNVTSQRNAQRNAFDDLRKRRLNEFMTGFGIITQKLKEMYQMITLGGDAELELIDSLDPFSEGITFSVRPPKKSWKNISNLSGGEKTLSSLALVFALHYYKPTPLYVMDEIDAALDFRNVSIVGNYIKERTRNAQFIVISLRNNMFELADRLVGIYKTDDCTKSVTINPGQLGDEVVEDSRELTTS